MFEPADSSAPESEIDTPELEAGAELQDDNADEPEGDQNDDQPGGEEEEGQELAFYLGDDELDSPSSEEDKDPALVKHLRHTIKEKERELKELRRQPSNPVVPQETIQPPRMPQMSDEDISWDEQVYQERVKAWGEENGKYQAQQSERQRHQQEAQQVYQQKVAGYQDRVKALKVPGYRHAEQAVLDDVPIPIQNAILLFAEKPEMVVLALGRNAELRKQMAEATDPVAIGRLIGSIESKARLMPKPKNKAASVPEVRGSNGAVMNNLEKLREKAEKSGDYTEYFAAKRAKK